MALKRGSLVGAKDCCIDLCWTVVLRRWGGGREMFRGKFQLVGVEMAGQVRMSRASAACLDIAGREEAEARGETGWFRAGTRGGCDEGGVRLRRKVHKQRGRQAGPEDDQRVHTCVRPGDWSCRDGRR